MEYSIMNESLRCNCLPIVITLLNLADINSKSRNKKIIRIGAFIHGVIGCFVLCKAIPGEIGLQAAFEWVMLYSVGYIPFFELFHGKLFKRVDKHYEKKEKLQGLNYSEEERHYSELAAEKITSFGNLISGIIILIITISPIFDKLIATSSDLYYLAKYNFILAALSCFGLYIKKKIRTKSLT